MIQTKPIAFFDVETTGTSITKDRIVEISICKLHIDGRREIKTRRVNPEIPIPVAASAIHKITYEDIKDEPKFKQIAKGLHDFIEGCDIGGFNSNSFDIPILYAEFYRSGIVWDYSNCNFIDVFNIYKRKEERTLGAAVLFYTGGVIENAHGAQADIEATVDVFQAQLERYPDLPQTADGLHMYCNFDNRMIDLSGWFTYGEDGQTVIYGKGKHKGQPVTKERSYLDWLAYKADDIPNDTREYAKKFIKE